MTHTGYMDMKQDRPPALPVMVHRLDVAADAIGLTLDLPEITKARGYLARAEELRAAYRTHKAQTVDDAQRAALGYATGKLTAEDLIAQVEATALLSGEVEKTAQRMIETSAAGTEREGVPLLHNITEARWLKLLRPVMDAALERAHAAADDLGIEGPRPQLVGIVNSAHPWAPSASDLKDMDVRHRWERLGAALDHLDAVHGFADLLRSWDLLPLVEGRTTREDYRWLHTDQLRGNAGQVREFFLINRHTAEPGLFTAADLATPPALVEAG